MKSTKEEIISFISIQLAVLGITAFLYWFVTADRPLFGPYYSEPRKGGHYEMDVRYPVYFSRPKWVEDE